MWSIKVISLFVGGSGDDGEVKSLDSPKEEGETCDVMSEVGLTYSYLSMKALFLRNFIGRIKFARELRMYVSKSSLVGHM